MSLSCSSQVRAGHGPVHGYDRRKGCRFERRGAWGARVGARQTGAATVTDREGQFTLTNPQASIRLTKGFSAIVYGLNLNSEVFGFYQGSPIYPIQRESYRPTVAAGLRKSLQEK